MDPVAVPRPRPALNRWTLEPLLFFIPLLTTLVLGAVLYVMLVSWGVAGLAVAALFVGLIVAMSVLGFLKRR